MKPCLTQHRVCQHCVVLTEDAISAALSSRISRSDMTSRSITSGYSDGHYVHIVPNYLLVRIRPSGTHSESFSSFLPTRNNARLMQVSFIFITRTLDLLGNTRILLYQRLLKVTTFILVQGYKILFVTEFYRVNLLIFIHVFTLMYT